MRAQHRPAQHRTTQHRRYTVTILLCLLILTSGGETSATGPASGPPVADQPTILDKGTHRWPFDPEPADPRAAVSAPFDAPPKPWLPGHRGVDIPADVDDPVLASAAGTVAFSGTVVNRPVVSIDHADGFRTTYEPVISDLKAGNVVGKGEAIGTIGTGGHCTNCLHWGARIGPQQYMDPLLLITGLPMVRLYP